MQTLSLTLSPRLLAGFGLTALLGGLGLMASHPARSVGGPVAVTVANVPLLTTAGDNPAKQPVQVQIALSQIGLDSTLYTVPAGKRLVIEYVNLFSNVLNDPDDYNFLLATNFVYTDFTLVPNGSPYVGTSQKVLLYAEPNQVVHGYFQKNGGNASPLLYVTLTGYLVNVP